MSRIKDYLFPEGWYFEILYLGVAIATFEHTAWAFGSSFLGLPGTEYFSLSDPIWARGALVAVAVDIGMFLVAKAIIVESRKNIISTWAIGCLIATFILVGLISTVSQIIFAVYHTPNLTIASGVTVEWIGRLQWMLDAAPFLMAGALPLMAVMFTLSRIGITVGKKEEARQALPSTHTLIVDGEYKEYNTISGVKKALGRYSSGTKHIEIPETTQLALEATNG